MATKNTAAKAASTPAIVRKALAEDNKSEGMRLLLGNGMSVADVAKAFGSPYGFVYGVAKRAGLSDTAANRRAPRKATKATARVSKAAKPAAKVTRVAAKSTPIKARATKASAASTAKAKGRPTAARRAANRKPRTTA